MKLGLALGYWGLGPTAQEQLEAVQEAEKLGFDSVWAAEAYGSDVVSVLSWLAAQTSTIKLGAGIMQIPARSAAMTAMTAATLDHLSEGRFVLGLGTSGPQVSEGWHGVRFARQLARTREYVDVVRMALRRERVEYHGSTLELPLPDGPGKALKLTIGPVQESIPIYIADYVLSGYGTGAIMAVPAHDERDFGFAHRFGLPIRRVVAAPGTEADDPMSDAYVAHTPDERLVNSAEFDGMPADAGGQGQCLVVGDRAGGRVGRCLQGCHAPEGRGPGARNRVVDPSRAEPGIGSASSTVVESPWSGSRTARSSSSPRFASWPTISPT